MNDYIFSNEFYRNVDLMVTTCGLEHCRPDQSYGWAARSSWMLHFVLKGQGVYRCRKREFHLKQGDFFLMIPGEKILYEADHDNPWTYCWVGLQGVKVKEYMERTCLPQDLVAHTEENSDLMDIVRVLEHIRYEENGDLHLNGLAYFLMYELARSFPCTRKSTQPDGEQYTKMILSYVEQNFDRPISISGIAEHFSLDRTYIHRLIKKAIGMSLQEYIISLRLANACSWLAFSDLSIGEIAHSVGYEDALAFSRIFRKRKGISPKAYRAEKRRPSLRSASDENSTDLNDSENNTENGLDRTQTFSRTAE